ncbi:MAG: isoprenyl transferase [Candidatus Neomarinimicrobiota bacterium]|nr:isoprenyl transferase [Candidatus Neomarinimicrobiota bacterium]
MTQSKKENILGGHIPKHIAIIMDGNGRWAKERSLPRIAGHKEGVNSVREITRACGEIGVKHLTLYTFSTENWRRPKAEVSALMTLLLKTISTEVKELHKNNVRFTAIGDLKKLPKSTQQGIFDGIDITKNNTGLNLCLALNYGSRQEMVSAVQAIAKKVKKGDLKLDEINETIFSNTLSTSDMPNPDLLIRTSGEYRLSNFLLWQCAYSEIIMTKTFWPAFREDALIEAILEYQSRERRFGKVSEQVNN